MPACAIKTLGGVIRLDPSAQLVSVQPNQIGGPAVVSAESIAYLRTSATASGVPFTAVIHVPPCSLPRPS